MKKFYFIVVRTPNMRFTFLTIFKCTQFLKCTYCEYSVVQQISAATAKSLQSCLTLCDPIDSSSPGSPVPGILQARTLEWIAISLSNAGK